MLSRILEFKISPHFMLRSWERSIDEQLLYKILPYVTVSNGEKKIAVATPSFLAQKGIVVKQKCCLVLVLSQKVLRTAFWCTDPNYLYKKEKQADFQWIYS